MTTGARELDRATLATIYHAPDLPAGTYVTLTVSDDGSGAEQPDLILMDLGLPILNGWQAAQRIKSTPSTRHIPIIAVTAYALTEDRDKSLAAGCDDYESKPIDFARLQAKIQTLLGGGRERS